MDKIRLTTKDDDYPIIYRFLTIPGGCLGFRPSTSSKSAGELSNLSHRPVLAEACSMPFSIFSSCSPCAWWKLNAPTFRASYKSTFGSANDSSFTLKKSLPLWKPSGFYRFKFHSLNMRYSRSGLSGGGDRFDVQIPPSNLGCTTSGAPTPEGPL